MIEKRQKVEIIMGELINTFDEYVFCMFFATKGIHLMGLELSNDPHKETNQIWVGSDCEKNPKMHARMKTTDCIKKCEKNGTFSNEITKSLLVTMYSLWDEAYRHKIAEAVGTDAKYIECPLMGDLRKIRHIIIHHKSIVPEAGVNFEILEWQLPSGKLEITYEMFLEFNDAVRGSGMGIRSHSPSPEMSELLSKMTKKERKSFEDFYKKPDNKKNNVKWPGLDAVLSRVSQLEKS
ncbi:hypothetical protein IB288_22660 [Vibrio parahaemolyticus]|uniref:hypothetical protein n=1 Tax=Vibrio parahaemolyticus TaxID=670 RepID=UPI001D161F55|nr:hypothetical protein [Vibrio parahaemolyticus]MCC3845760.1 hypothetical protein [Vibrio parahaemolyticus]